MLEQYGFRLMRVLAIDPGTLRMGYGVLDADPTPEADDYGVVALPASMPIEKRLYQLHTHILNMIHVFNPDAIAVEDPFVGRGERAFVKSALAIGQAQAVVLIGAGEPRGFRCFRYSPAAVKMAVADYGRASKEQVQQITISRLGIPDQPPEDASDALAVGLCHLQSVTDDALASREIPPGKEL